MRKQETSYVLVENNQIGKRTVYITLQYNKITYNLFIKHTIINNKFNAFFLQIY